MQAQSSAPVADETSATGTGSAPVLGRDIPLGRAIPLENQSETIDHSKEGYAIPQSTAAPTQIPAEPTPVEPIPVPAPVPAVVPAEPQDAAPIVPVVQEKAADPAATKPIGTNARPAATTAPKKKGFLANCCGDSGIDR